MSTTATLIHTAGIQVLPLIRAAAGLAAVAGFLMFFRPLLVGIGRALVLVVFPRVPRKSLGQRQLRDVEMLQRAINAAQGPSDTAELRALAARG